MRKKMTHEFFTGSIDKSSIILPIEILFWPVSLKKFDPDVL